MNQLSVFSLFWFLAAFHCSWAFRDWKNSHALSKSYGSVGEEIGRSQSSPLTLALRKPGIDVSCSSLIDLVCERALEEL